MEPAADGWLLDEHQKQDGDTYVWETKQVVDHQGEPVKDPEGNIEVFQAMVMETTKSLSFKCPACGALSHVTEVVS
jgi:heat shock protein HspQ